MTRRSWSGCTWSGRRLSERLAATVCAAALAAALSACQDPLGAEGPEAEGDAAAAQAPEPAPSFSAEEAEAYRVELTDLVQRAARGECEDAYPALTENAEHPLFEGLPPEGQALVYEMSAWCALTLEVEEAALAYAAELDNLPGDPASSGLIQYSVAAAYGEAPEAARRLIDWAEAAPASLRNLRMESIGLVINSLRNENEKQLLLETFDALEAANYSPTDPAQSMDGLRVEYARLLIEAKRLRHARAQAVAITRPGALIELKADKAFDPMTTHPSIAPKLDIEAAAEAYAEQTRLASLDNPGRLSLVVEYADALQTLGRFEESLEVADAALAALEADAGRYSDTDERLNWLHSARARALGALGRPDEQVAALEAAIAHGEFGQANVSQTMSLASLHIMSNEPQKALDLLEDIGNLSDFGVQTAAALKVCAAVLLGDEALKNENLDEIRANARERIYAAETAFLCAELDDELAALYAEQLSDPVLRGDALLTLQVFKPDPNLGPFEDALRERFLRVRAREDVAAALEPVGRLYEFDLY